MWASRDEPALQLVAAHDLADDHIIGAVIAGVGGQACQRARVEQDGFVGIKQARQLGDGRLASARRARDRRFIDHVLGQREGDAAQCLHALGQGVHDQDLVVVVLVKGQKQLVEGGAGSLPVRLLVGVADGHGVGQQPVQGAHGLRAHFGGQADAHVGQGAEGLQDVGGG